MENELWHKCQCGHVDRINLDNLFVSHDEKILKFVYQRIKDNQQENNYYGDFQMSDYEDLVIFIDQLDNKRDLRGKLK